VKTRNIKLASATLAVAVLLAGPISAQTTPVNFNGFYFETFNTFGTVQGQSVYPSGWNGYKITGNGGLADGSFITNTTTPPIIVTDGNSNIGSIHNFGNVGDPNRALGSFAGPLTTAGFGIVLVNNTGAAIDGADYRLTYTAEQWITSGSNNVTESWVFQYKTVPGSTTLDMNELTNDGWTDVPALFMTEIRTDLEGSGAINGDLPENQAILSATLNGLIWGAGDRLVFRWLDTNDPGNDAGMGVGNFVFGPVPEPSSMLLIGGAACVGCFWHRRRRTPVSSPVR
jgi:hypothetical protein